MRHLFSSIMVNRIDSNNRQMNSSATGLLLRPRSSLIRVFRTPRVLSPAVQAKIWTWNSQKLTIGERHILTVFVNPHLKSIRHVRLVTYIPHWAPLRIAFACTASKLWDSLPRSSSTATKLARGAKVALLTESLLGASVRVLFQKNAMLKNKKKKARRRRKK